MAGTAAPEGPLSRWDPLMLVLCGVLLQYVWRIQEVFPVLGKIQFTALVSLGACALFLADGSPLRRITYLGRGLFPPVLVIAAIAVLSVPTSVHAGMSFRFLTSNFLKTVVLSAILAASIRDRADVERLLRVFVLGGAGYILAAMALASPDGGRLAASQGSYDPNDLGLFAVSTVPLCLYLIRRGAHWLDRLAGLVAALILVSGAIQSGSRGGFLALVAVGLYGLILLDTVRASRRVLITVIALMLMVGVVGDTYWNRMRTIMSPQKDYNWAGQSDAGRIEVWKRGLGYMFSHPITGVGVSAFAVAEGTMAPQAARQSMGIGWKWSTAHNAYVEIGAELGVFGLAAFVALMWRAFNGSRRIGRLALTRRDRLLGQAFGALVVAFAIGAAFLSQAFATYLYFGLAILAGFSRIVMRELRHHQVPMPAESETSVRHIDPGDGRGRRGRSASTRRSAPPLPRRIRA